MIKIYQSKNNKKEYPYITGYISNFLLRHKKELPKFLKVKIYDYEDLSIYKDNLTGLEHSKDKTGRAYDFILHINLKQILDLYTGRKNLSIPSRDLPGKIKGIKQYLLFVIYHELGHYNLEHHNKFNEYKEKRIEAEKNCDLFAYNKLLQGQGQFEFAGSGLNERDKIYYSKG